MRPKKSVRDVRTKGLGDGDTFNEHRIQGLISKTTRRCVCSANNLTSTGELVNDKNLRKNPPWIICCYLFGKLQ